MFNIGGQEFMLIMLVALLVLGPDRLPGAVRRFGQVVGELKRMSGGFQAEIREALAEPMDAMKDVKKSVDDVTKGFKDVNAEMKSTITSASAPAAAAATVPAVAAAPPTPEVEAAANTAKDPFASAVASSAAPPALAATDGGTGEAGSPPAGNPPFNEGTPDVAPEQNSTAPPDNSDSLVTPMPESAVDGEMTGAESSVASPGGSTSLDVVQVEMPSPAPAPAQSSEPPAWAAEAHAAAASSLVSPVAHSTGNGVHAAPEQPSSVEHPEPEPELPEWMRRLQEAQRQP